MTLKSVNGPAATWIVGYQVPGTTNGDGAIRCVYLSAGAVLSGFTLTNGATRKLGDTEHEQKGGGVWCPSTTEVITNCVLARNSSYVRGGGVYGGTLNHCILRDNSSQYGGGAFGGLLTGCVLTGNTGGMFGGGANDSVLNNCTLTGNSAWVGGGAYNSWLNNCISYFNTASGSSASANYSGLPVNFCCTTPQPSGGFGNFTNAPLLVDLGGGDLHLQSNSPCINAGRNACVSIATDLDRQPRISGGTVDVGAYEFQLPLSVISYAWLQSYGLPTDGTADYLDSDSDGMNNWQEWIAGTMPHRWQFGSSNAHSSRKPQPRHIDLAKHDQPRLLAAAGGEFGGPAVFHLPGVEHPWRLRDNLVFRHQRACRRRLVPRRRSTAVASDILAHGSWVSQPMSPHPPWRAPSPHRMGRGWG